ncbi:hypothetical protein [Pseudodonghicola flavimaris]|uniref:Tetratricopeptide repeat protein n=1 Tax=Pseudodonghicola flavimaris TaxID=3050036 RepID=A0ABT7EV23_9RHOB|nr:hypothetical protein [Pseudodonghicola flavimaris]MDK3016139.1 hypothetical protein [Pseudodonghicola flavimaris]
MPKTPRSLPALAPRLRAPKLLSVALTRLGLSAGTEGGATVPREVPEELLDIPVREQSAEDRAARAARDRGLFLARQDRWEELSQELHAADLARSLTPGCTPLADHLSFGARSDVVLAVEEALADGKGRSRSNRSLLDGIMGLEAMRQEHRHDPYINLVLAQAHMDIAWAWRGTADPQTLPKLNRHRCAAHLDRAAHLLAPFDAAALSSPALGAAQCTLLADRHGEVSQIADAYAAVIDLDPRNLRLMRSLGLHLLPRRGGSHATLEVEARRTAARTADIWGAGGYTWVLFDAIARDPGAMAHVDVDFFTEGLRDILATRPDQPMVNLLTAYCALSLRDLPAEETAREPQRRIAASAGWLIRDHLTELHPLIWAHAAEGFDNAAYVRSARRFAARGRADGLRAIAEQFRDDLDQGLRITFTPDGPVVAGTH